jgi:hypothetical protein
MAGDEDLDLEWDDLTPKLIVAGPEDLTSPTQEWGELEQTTPQVAPTDPLVATFTDLDLAPTPDKVTIKNDADWVD